MQNAGTFRPLSSCDNVFICASNQTLNLQPPWDEIVWKCQAVSRRFTEFSHVNCRAAFVGAAASIFEEYFPRKSLTLSTPLRKSIIPCSFRPLSFPNVPLGTNCPFLLRQLSLIMAQRFAPFHLWCGIRDQREPSAPAEGERKNRSGSSRAP